MSGGPGFGVFRQFEAIARPSLLLGGAFVALLLIACDGPDGIAVAPPTETPPPAPTPTASPAPTPAGTPEPTATPGALPERCRDGEEQLAERLEHLDAEIEAAMAGYPGDWGFGMIDLDCGVELTVRGDYVQYTASAGKIVPVIAALRAVDPGTFAASIPADPPPLNCGVHGPLGAAGEPVDFARLEEALRLVMVHSCDHEANLINDLVTPEQIAEVLELADVSEQTRFEYRWNQAFMPAIDLARVWAALLEGRLLDGEMTEYLLALSSSAVIPQGLDTFPADPGIPGWQLGQKAGYCIVCDPYTLVGLGAGYLRPEDGGEVSARAGDHLGVAVVLMVRTTTLSVADPQRREVFPHVVDYVLGDR